MHDPLAWRRSSFASVADFTLELDARERAEIAASLEALERGGRLAPAHALGGADFEWPTLGARLRQAYREVRSGRGFVVLRGLPVEGMRLEQFVAAVWGVGTHFGRPLSQNAQGELIGHVIDASQDDPTPRMYRSKFELRAHNDVTAMISLACWRQAAAGGVSVLTSALAVHDEIRRRAPRLLEPLYRGFHYHRLGEEAEGEEPTTPYRMPVFARRNGQISCRYQRAGIAAGHLERGVPIEDIEIEAMDLFDEVARAPENRVAFDLQPGEMVMINNYTVMHARTAFTEHPQPERRRHLVRLWLDAEGFRDVPRELYLFDVNGVPRQQGRSCSYDFKKLYGNDARITGGLPELRVGADELMREH